MKAFLALCLMLSSALAWGARVVGDTVPEADVCIYTLDSGPEGSVPVVEGWTCVVDVSHVTPGPHNIQIKVRNSVWGPSYDSPFAGLDFVRPGQLPAPSSLRLAP